MPGQSRLVGRVDDGELDEEGRAWLVGGLLLEAERHAGRARGAGREREVHDGLRRGRVDAVGVDVFDVEVLDGAAGDSPGGEDRELDRDLGEGCGVAAVGGWPAEGDGR